jgi:two-component system, chemotaxis family, protein-glutamate methylesterase/glutaminase
MTQDKPVRVLIVDDSRTHRATLRAMLEKQPDVTVVGSASDGLEAVAAAQDLKPDVILMDVRMPRLDGLEATRRIMAERPTPILLMTAADNLVTDVDLALRALEYGALDVMAKPELALEDLAQGRALASKLRLLAGVPVISHPIGRTRLRRGEDPLAVDKTTFHRRAQRVVGVVASTGGPSALRALLSSLPADLKAAVVIVQHIDAAFEEGLVRWLDEECPLTVVTPRDGQDLIQGTAYVAPQRRFCEVTERRRLALKEEPYAAGSHCPSGDRLLETIARSYGNAGLGVVLTGMGSDGAKGLLAVRKAGGVTIAQDEATSVIYGMPQAAATNGAAQRILPLDKIGAALVEALL